MSAAIRPASVLDAFPIMPETPAVGPFMPAADVPPPGPVAAAPPPAVAAAGAPAPDAISPQRRGAIEAWVHDNAQPGGLPLPWVAAGHDRVSGALSGASALGPLDAPEQRLLATRSVDVWQAGGNAGEIGRFGDDLAGRGAIAQFGARLYAERAAGVARASAGHDWDGATRTLGGTFAAGAVRVAGQGDAVALRALVNGLGAARAGEFGDALSWNVVAPGSSLSGENDKGRLAAMLGALNAGPQTSSGRGFVTHVFASATEWTYRDVQVGEFGGVHDFGQTDVAQPMATALSRLAHPDDPAAQARDTARLGAILASPIGARLFAPDYASVWSGPDAESDQVSTAARFQALDAIVADPSITAQSLSRQDSPWTDPVLSEGLARGAAQALLQARGDTAQALPGTTLDNTVGVAMHLAPATVPAGESPAQRATREQGIAAGTVSAYAGGRDAEPVRLVADAVREAAGQVGGDRAAPRVTVLPVQLTTAGSGPVQLPLFRVDGPGGERYVDNRGGVYASFGDWQGRNALPDGTMTFPPGGHLSADGAGRVRLASADTPETHDTLHHVEHVLDKVALVGGVVAGGAIAIGSGGTLAPAVLLVAGAYGAGRSAQDLAEMNGRGQTLDPVGSGEARSAWLSLAASALTGAGAVSGSLARAAAGTGVLSRSMAGAAVGLNTAAVAVDAGAMANQTVDAALDWDRLSPPERLAAGLNLAFWGLGARAQNRGDIHETFDFEAQRTRMMADRAPARHDPDMPGSTGRVYYDGTGARLGEVRVVVGPGATREDIALHDRVAARLAEGSGVEGVVRRRLGASQAPIGSRRWEAEAEVDKLDRVVADGERRLAGGGLSSPDRAQLRADVASWRSERDGHVADLARYDATPALGLAPGRGFIERTSGGRDEAARLGRPEIPHPGYHWAMVEGELRIRPNKDGASLPHRVWDDATGQAAEAAGDPVRPGYVGERQSFAVPKAVQDAEMAPVLRERDRARAEYQPLARLESDGVALTPAQGAALKRSQQEVIRASAALGEHGAAAYVRARYDRPGAPAELVYGGPGAGSRPGDFDQVWRVQGADGSPHYVVVEAKGGTSPLGTRMVGDTPAMQGTRLYFDKIVQLMGGAGQRADARQAAVELRLAARRDAVTYLEARTPVKVDARGRASSPRVDVHAFDLRAQP